MAHAASLHLDEHFMRVGLGPIDFFDSQRLSEFVQDGGFHRVHLEKVALRNSVHSKENSGVRRQGKGHILAKVLLRVRRIQLHFLPVR
jgi:hypothetical protein